MSAARATLYDLLPAIYRTRDAEQGGPLEALLAVVAEQVAVLQEDLEQLYDDQFIETCADWVVPYLGDLLGYRGLHGVVPQISSPRAEVANTLRFRRRKGTAAMLEQFARDVTGWPARAVEFFQLLATTQYLNHLRLDNRATLDLRRADALERLQGPFDDSARTVEVRSIARGRGRYNLPNVGLFLWRLGAYSHTESIACRVSDGCYTFHPLGIDIPLFNRPEPEDEIAHLAERAHVPAPLTRAELEADLGSYYGVGKSLLLRVGEQVVAPGPDQKTEDLIVVCDLSDVAAPEEASHPRFAHAHRPTHRIAIDPVLGRIALPRPPGAGEETPAPEEVTTAAGREVRVTYHYGFSTEMGGGEYPRQATFDRRWEEGRPPLRVPGGYPDLQDALGALGAADGVVEITDNGRYTEVPAITAAADQQLEFRARDGRRPTLALTGEWEIGGAPGAMVTLNGLLISGGLRLRGGGWRLRLRHCTLVPGRSLAHDGRPERPELPALSLAEATEGDAPITVEIDHSIVGPLHLPHERARLEARDSIVDSPAREQRARCLPALVSGDLTSFPSLGPGPLALTVTIGDSGPHLILLPGAPTELEGIRAQLEAAICGVAPGPGFARCRVLAADGRLVLLPGTLAPLRIGRAGADLAAERLLLLPPQSRQARALLSGSLAPFRALRSATPALRVTLGGWTREVALPAPPEDLPDARQRLQQALDPEIAPALAGTLVLLLDDRLLVVPGTEETAPLFSASAADPTTVYDLALGLLPALAGDASGAQPGPASTLERATVLGPVHVRELTVASAVIFTAPVEAERRQSGCVRFSFVPDGSRTPFRHRCQPEAGSGASELQPLFTATRYGDPVYGQLSPGCPPEIRQGAEDEAEMGAFHDLFQPQREMNLRVRLDEYLRFSLEAGIFYVT
jgi:hypothetical protein